MTCTLHVAWDERLASYDFGPQHPLAPIRVKLTMELAQALGVLSRDGVTVTPAGPATDAELQLVHDPRYIDVVKKAGTMAAGGSGRQLDAATLLTHGLGTEDDPVFAGMHEAAALVTGATLSAARAVLSGSAQHGASIAGGLHHAMRGNASGFCIYNDPAIAIAWLLQQGIERIAYVDIDVHHGDGVQAAFWDDPRVLTISLHQHPATLFPGTGRPTRPAARPPRARRSTSRSRRVLRDAGWLRALDASGAAAAAPVPPPDPGQPTRLRHALERSAGQPADHHRRPASRTRGRASASARNPDGRWLLTGGGGYQFVQVVPRTWTHLLAEASGQPIEPDTPTPASWREYVQWVAAESAPELMTEGASADFPRLETGHDPADPVDQAIMATRNAVFPLHGLFP